MNMKDLLQVLSVLSLIIGSILNMKKKKECFLFYQVGCLARMINYLGVGLHIELVVQVFFTFINVKSYLVWKDRK